MGATIPHREKIIVLKEDTFRTLSVMAAKQGTSLKRLIEAMLGKAADEYGKNESYRYLSEDYPSGKIILGREEHKELIDWLEVVEK